ncbi:hypothetical protein H4219_002526 [Mycoemilia scoparia]|uniref:Fork-head domain-containing protein n=1 Tax=Mycoemilia scoparia TaxID=417184 RepID=A0A9W8DP08_9FUNG|nr:hypothetical protein H4219_002526 [Mycoemilia scoparia]
MSQPHCYGQVYQQAQDPQNGQQQQQQEHIHHHHHQQLQQRGCGINEEPLFPTYQRKILPYPIQTHHSLPTSGSYSNTRQNFVPIVPLDVSHQYDAAGIVDLTKKQSGLYHLRPPHTLSSSAYSAAAFPTIPQSQAAVPLSVGRNEALLSQQYQAQIIGESHYACSPQFLDLNCRPKMDKILAFLLPKDQSCEGSLHGTADGPNTTNGGSSIVNDLGALLSGKAKIRMNTVGKPPFSYATLIAYAILNHVYGKKTLSEIYDWMMDHFSHFESGKSGWRNSIRHNLSLNKIFVHVPRTFNEPGKGSYWTVDLRNLYDVLNSTNRGHSHNHSQHQRTISRSVDRVAVHPISPALQDPTQSSRMVLPVSSLAHQQASSLDTPTLQVPISSTHPISQLSSSMQSIGSAQFSAFNPSLTIPETTLGATNSPMFESHPLTPVLFPPSLAASGATNLFQDFGIVPSDPIAQHLMQRRPSSASPTTKTRKMPRLSITSLFSSQNQPRLQDNGIFNEQLHQAQMNSSGDMNHEATEASSSIGCGSQKYGASLGAMDNSMVGQQDAPMILIPNVTDQISSPTAIFHIDDDTAAGSFIRAQQNLAATSENTSNPKSFDWGNIFMSSGMDSSLSNANSSSISSFTLTSQGPPFTPNSAVDRLKRPHP